MDLTNHIERMRLVARMQADVDAFCRAEFDEDPRKHLGASVIGDDCQAKAWNAFRWLHFEEFDGRMLRLFNRGHEEEARFIKWLKGIGFSVWDFDPQTKKQFRIRGAKGHFGGSLDSILRAPPSYGVLEDLLGEFKTHNEKSFAKLAGPKLSAEQMKAGKLRTGGQGVKLSKPQHFRQMCSYGRAYQFKFGLYCAVNKDTDELYFEIVELDYRQADDLFRKAEGIIFSRTRPPKIAQVATFFDCKYCAFAGYCHGDAVPSKNCRSCVFAVPVEDGQWSCEHPNTPAEPIPDEMIKTGCGLWRRIA